MRPVTLARVRVISGSHRGRRLSAPSGTDTRPTGDRVREALFSILGPIEDVAVLDLFAGSGALGIEALSRGASRVTFVDSDAAAIRAVQANLQDLDLTRRAAVQRMDARAFLRRRAARGDTPEYDLVFLDPPYRLAAALGATLSELLPAALRPGAVVVAESDRRAPLPLDLPLNDERRYGDTLIRIHGLR